MRVVTTMRRDSRRRMLLRRGAVSLGALAVLGGLAGCDDDGPIGAVEAGAESDDVTVVQALDNTFRGETVVVGAGTEIRWQNVGLNQHDIVPRGGTDDWGVDKDGFNPGDVYRAEFRVPGEYQYYCSLHGTETSGMVGTIVVEEDES